ncbi:hypothetical protein MP228_006907 [Amoeboaphelidium protococcarum]|nr:hypothetical protein MP228_006907 [Amoeboaphelidium protococcarum]
MPALRTYTRSLQFTTSKALSTFPSSNLSLMNARKIQLRGMGFRQTQEEFQQVQRISSAEIDGMGGSQQSGGQNFYIRQWVEFTRLDIFNNHGRICVSPIAEDLASVDVFSMPLP